MGGGGLKASVGSSSSRARVDGDRDPYEAPDRPRDGERRAVKQGRGGGGGGGGGAGGSGGKKSVPLYKRLAAQAKMEAERESKEKVSQLVSQSVS